MVLAEDEDVIEQLPAQGARQPFGERVHVRHPGRRPYDPCPRRCENSGEASAELRVAVADEDRGRSIQGGVAGLLRAPCVAWRAGHRGVDDLAAPEVEEEKDEDLAEPDVVGLHEVARPRDMIAQECRPALPSASGLGPRMTHVPLDGSLADADAKLQQLAAEALRAPARIACDHLADERRARRRGSPRGPSAAAPDRADACPVPAEERRRLDQKRGVAPGRRHARDEPHRETLPWGPPDPPRDLPLRHDELLPQQRVLGDEAGAAAQDVGGQPHDEPKDVGHAASYPSSAQMGIVAITGTSQPPTPQYWQTSC